MIKVSIIVPIYNTEKYLSRCIESLVSQTLEDIEIILINDKSPDHSADIMEEYKKKFPDKIVTVYLPTNQQQGAARNIGIRMAKGEYILFVDSDDWVDMTICEKLYSSAKRNNAELAYCDYKTIDENSGKERYMMDVMPEQEGELTDDKKRSLIDIMAYPFTKLVLKSLLLDNNVMFAEGIRYEDKVAVPLFVLYAKRLAKVNEALYYYNLRQGSTVHTQNATYIFDRMKAARLCYNQMKERGFYTKFKEEIEFNFIKEYYLIMLHSCLEKYDNPPIEKMESLVTEMKNEFPNYRDNLYIDKVFDPMYLNIADVAEKSCELLIQEYRKNQKNFKSVSYGKYYCYYNNKLEKLLKKIREDNKVVGIWGYGQKGQDLYFSLAEEEKKSVSYLIDGNLKKCGNRIDDLHLIYSYLEIKDKIDVILVSNRFHYGAIYNEIKSDNSLEKIKIINLDNYLVYDLMCRIK